ncbi:hypothetical protein PT974_11685 [Cladobotryum mycophilum]|uniref:F-box domain-containing protein n=1 Tax=Cladobotryum mycophilum TaxID=491253 RepID=A0ABR0S601_9HYPO
MSSDYPANSEVAIEAGRHHYAAKRYKPALEQFTRAMKNCPCSRGMKRERCSCKNFEEVASKDESIFKEAMYNCKCAVGRTFNKCDKSLHIQALDYRAATFEALNELDRAKRDAEWILELAPRLPDGYLRLGKIARLQKKNEYAWKIYNAGIEVSLDNGTEKSAKVEQLYKARQPLQTRYLKKDPMHMPLEIIQLIFSYLDLVTLVRCLRVCKIWRQALIGQGNQRLWRALMFTGSAVTRRPPRMEAIRRLLKNSGNDVRELVIEDGRQFYLSKQKFLAILDSARNLERLELWSLFEPLDLPIPLKNLKYLVLRGFDDVEYVAHFNNSPFHKFLVNAAENLESMRLAGFPMAWRNGDPIPPMPQLKYLILEGSKTSTSTFTLPILEFLTRTPQLEQLMLDSPNIDDNIYKERKPEDVYPTLKYLRIIERRTLNPLSLYDQFSSLTIEAYSSMTCLSQGKGFQALDVVMAGDYGPTDLYFSDIISSTHRDEAVAYEDMESFRLRSLAVDPPRAEKLFEKAVFSGRLHTFDIVFPLESLNDRIGESSAEHLKGYQWLRGAESIRSMGLFSFSFSSIYRSETDMPLLGFLMSFPNLEVLEIESDRYEEAGFCMLIRDILKVTKLKTLHQYRVKGAMMDQLNKLAEKSGVTLVWGRDRGSGRCSLVSNRSKRGRRVACLGIISSVFGVSIH